MGRRLNYCDWGYEGDGLTVDEEKALLKTSSKRFDGADFERKALVPAEEVTLHDPRVTPPQPLQAICSTTQFDRLTHTYGQSYPDFVRMFDADYANAPDIVAWANSENDIEAVMDWAAGQKLAVIPYGGGSSVVRGVEPEVGAGFNGTISLDLTGLNKVLEIDRTNQAARIQSGASGPEIETGLREHGLTMRHFPQSFEMASLGHDRHTIRRTFRDALYSH